MLKTAQNSLSSQCKEAIMPSNKKYSLRQIIESVKLYDGTEVCIYNAFDTELFNRGYVCDELSVWNGDTKLGYLKSAYIDASEFKKFNPTIWHYMNNFGGMCCNLNTFSEDVDNLMTMPEEKFQSFASSICQYSLSWGEANKKENRYEAFAGDRSAFLEKMSKTRYAKNAIKKRQEHIKRVVDKPFVDYIQTGENTYQGVNQDSQGRGLGFLMYIASANLYKGLGKQFYSSSIQSDKAKKMWEGFHKSGWAIPYKSNNSHNIRYKMDYKNLPTLVEAVELLNDRKSSKAFSPAI